MHWRYIYTADRWVLHFYFHIISATIEVECMNFIIKTIYKTSIAGHSFACLFNNMWVRLKAESTEIYIIFYLWYFLFISFTSRRDVEIVVYKCLLLLFPGGMAAAALTTTSKKCDYIIISVNKSKNKTKRQNKYWLGVSPSLSFVFRSFSEVSYAVYCLCNLRRNTKISYFKLFQKYFFYSSCHFIIIIIYIVYLAEFFKVLSFKVEKFYFL